ncbi:M56 family metallopeptidase [Dysosmobacter sp.]
MFVELLNTSISASWLILAIMVIRVIFKRMPKAVNCVLWGLVAIRLICPFSIESSLSLIPSAETIPEEILYMEGAQQHDPVYFDGIVMPEVQETVGEVVGSTVSQVQTFDVLGTLVWLAGMAVMLLYVLVSYLRLRHRVMVSINERDNIWVCDRIDSPFILGIFRPRIYMPSNMEEAQAAYVIAHEQAHLNRRDHWWKPLGFFLLTVYWFNPLIWVAYILLSRDIELACDEKVVRSMEMADKQAYSEALLVCSVNRRMIAACPLAFGEVGVKARVKSVLNYKKPAFWVFVGSVIICVVVAVCFLTDPETDSEDVPETPCEHQPGEFVSYEWREAPDPDVPSDKIREQQWERYVCTKCGEEFEVEVASRLISGEKKEYPVREFLTEEDFEDPVATAIKLLSRAYSFDPAAYTPTVSQNGDFWNITFDWEHHYVVELTPKLPYPQTLYEFRRVPPGGYGEVEIPAEGELVEIAEEILWNAYALKGEDAQIEVVQGEDKICVQFVFLTQQFSMSGSIPEI